MGTKNQPGSNMVCQECNCFPASGGCKEGNYSADKFTLTPCAASGTRSLPGHRSFHDRVPLCVFSSLLHEGLMAQTREVEYKQAVTIVSPFYSEALA